MNERIKALAEEHGFRYDNAEWQFADDSDVERFAESIVKKFDDILVLEYLDCISNKDNKAAKRVEQLREKVKIYFGVEE